MQKLAIIIGRCFLSILFIVSAIYKILDWKEMQKALIKALCEWQNYTKATLNLQECFADIWPWLPAVLIVSVTVELLGGLSIFFNIWARLGAFLLLVFLAISTVIFDHFWFVEGAKQDLMLIMFMKNVAIMGGLFYVIAFGGSSGKKKKVDSMDLPEID